MCDNPWKKCNKKDITLAIVYRGKEKEICRKCWKEIAESDRQWSNS